MSDDTLVREAEAVVRWGREAQDKEYQHLRLIDAKLREDGVELPRRLSPPMPGLMAGSWALASRTLSLAFMRRAILLNAEAEDHAEHYYAELVALHPEWEDAAGRAARPCGTTAESPPGPTSSAASASTSATT